MRNGLLIVLLAAGCASTGKPSQSALLQEDTDTVSVFANEPLKADTSTGPDYAPPRYSPWMWAPDTDMGWKALTTRMTLPDKGAHIARDYLITLTLGQFISPGWAGFWAYALAVAWEVKDGLMRPPSYNWPVGGNGFSVADLTLGALGIALGMALLEYVRRSQGI